MNADRTPSVASSRLCQRPLFGAALALGLGALALSPATAQTLDPEVAARPRVECTTDDTPRLNNRGTWEANLWPGGVVPFEFDNNVSASNQTAMLAAMGELEAVCNVRFVPRNGEDPWIHIQNSDGNNSPVGNPGSGSNTINIFNWNVRFIMVHELMHTLGVRHEQSRTDRDTFVIIHLANVCQDCCSGGPCDHNFAIADGSTTCGDYDFDSVMHYPGDAFSTNGMLTIECQPAYAAFQNLMGQRTHLSTTDIACLSSHYGAPFGACCAPDGTCTSAQQADCTGVWLGGDIPCSPNPCTGACCAQNGTCSITLPGDCTGTSAFRGVAVPCEPSTCNGACCSPGGVCAIRSATDCAGINGIFRGTDAPCEPLTCPGACCSQAGDCTVTSVTLCSGSGGVFRGTDAPCEPLTCPGACCAFTGECTFTSTAVCSAAGGSWRGLDLPCEPLACPGACCLLDRSCIATGLDICTGQRGTYLGLDTTCDNMPCCCRPWDNGYADGHGGQASQIGPDASWEPLVGVSFDDFWLCEGQINIIDHVSGVVATNSLTPKFIIAILPDCNGLPDITAPVAVAGLAGTRFDVAQEDVPFILGRIEQDVHRGPDADGFSLIEAKAVFDGKKLALKGGAYWVTVFGVSATLNPLDEFFWQTSGQNVVKGRPGLFYDGDTFRTSDELCCGCTDYNFCVEGETCKVLLDNGPPVVNFGPIQFPGVPSLQNGGNIQTRSRAADKVVLAPCDPFEPCYIEGYVWTNCDRVAMQLFPDGCHCPDDDADGSAFRFADCVMSTGVRVFDPTGVEIELKKAQFFFADPHEMQSLVGENLTTGRNIWLSLVGFGENRQNARAYFAFASRCDRPCNSFGPGCFRPAPFDITHWGPNGIEGTSVPGFDHAFLIAVRDRTRRVLLPPMPVRDLCPADVNHSGTVSVQDLFDFLAIYFAGCP